METKKFKTMRDLIIEKVGQARTEGRQMHPLLERMYDNLTANKKEE